MLIRNAEPPLSAVKKSQYPEEDLPLIALFGRSNAGKSSLINVLVNRKGLARTSSAPGKTRLLNFYRVAGQSREGAGFSWFFVDLPGYGYAKVGKGERQHWLEQMEELLQSNRPLYCWQLLDIRHEPSREDKLMHRALTEAGFPLLTIANKADKISRSARAKSLKTIRDSLDPPPRDLLVFSAVSREGREELLARAEQFLAAGPADEPPGPPQ
mgnify:CR=1 FL=1